MSFSIVVLIISTILVVGCGGFLVLYLRWWLGRRKTTAVLEKTFQVTRQKLDDAVDKLTKVKDSLRVIDLTTTADDIALRNPDLAKVLRILGGVEGIKLYEEELNRTVTEVQHELDTIEEEVNQRKQQFTATWQSLLIEILVAGLFFGLGLAVTLLAQQATLCTLLPVQTPICP